MIRITELKLELNQAENKAMEFKHLKQHVVSKYRIPADHILSMEIFKKAVDARKKSHVFFVYSVDLSLKNESRFLENHHKQVSLTPNMTYQEIPSGTKKLSNRPVIVGFGPSGLFAAYLLAKRGYQPVVLERGLDVDERTMHVKAFQKTGNFDTYSTILFGEGGAGTFSDGKLTTLINDLRSRFILSALVLHGADREIMYINKPHIGTDQLKIIMKSMRNKIIKMGGTIRFDAIVTDFIIHDSKLQAIKVNHDETIETNVCLLGIGHSARDTFETLYHQQVEIQQKPFSIGVRIEHPQAFINQAQYGDYATSKALGAADYKLSYHAKNGRSAYTFCMCPGGYVMCASSEAGGLVTNGMSESIRNQENANSALLVNVTPEDFKSDHPLAGVAYQRAFEQKAFVLGGSTYHAPVQLVGDFMNHRKSHAFGHVTPSYQPGTTFADLHEILPDYITETMIEALLDFDQKINGFAMKDAILTGVETRSSSPIRILRNAQHESNIIGLYPMGEGAGYAGGIMSSAVDGMKTAEKIIAKYSNQ